MTNLFQAIKNYTINNAKTYGDLLNPSIENNLSYREREAYESLKVSDKNRLIIENNLNRVDNHYQTPSKQSIGGISGEVFQIY